MRAERQLATLSYHHWYERMERMYKWGNEILDDVGLTRRDLRYKFKRCYVPAFNPLWWAITIGLVAVVGLVVYGLVVSVILMAP